MEEGTIYITINHIDEFCPCCSLRVGDELTLKKDTDNCYDDEAIAVYDRNNIKVGYVANSVSTVARGTFSAGRLYNRIGNEAACVTRFITEEVVIASLYEK